MIDTQLPIFQYCRFCKLVQQFFKWSTQPLATCVRCGNARYEKVKKPSVTTNCVAHTYAAPNERIIEFTFPDGHSGLISFRDIWTQNGNDTVHTLIVDLYRMDAGITVLVPPGHIHP